MLKTMKAERTNIDPMGIEKDVISAFKKIAENSEEIECKILRLFELKFARDASNCCCLFR